MIFSFTPHPPPPFYTLYFSSLALSPLTTLSAMKYAMSKIDNVWGVDGLDRPTKYYENKLWFVLKEYLKSLETEEVQKWVRGL